MKKTLAVLGLAVATLAGSAPAFALSLLPKIEPPPTTRPTVAAPEIDVAAGTKGIAVLIAALLLAAEGYRRRR